MLLVYLESSYVRLSVSLCSQQLLKELLFDPFFQFWYVQIYFYQTQIMFFGEGYNRSLPSHTSPIISKSKNTHNMCFQNIPHPNIQAFAKACVRIGYLGPQIFKKCPIKTSKALCSLTLPKSKYLDKTSMRIENWQYWSTNLCIYPTKIRIFQ